MSRGRRGGDGGGGWIAWAIGALLVLALVLWVLSSIGHALDLTPTFSELTDRPDGWVGDHYRGVFVGYLLTLLVIGFVTFAAWTGYRLMSTEIEPQRRSWWLTRVGGAGAVLLLVVLVAPIGRRERPVDGGGVAQAQAAPATTDVVNEERPRPVRVRIGWPRSGMQTRKSSVVVRGRVAGASTVTVDGHLADLRHGRFRGRASLAVGRNALRVRATADDGRQAAARVVVVRRRPPPPPPAPAPAQPACDPDYEGACLDPDAIDYDCAGGSGDGPEYTGPVRVVGSDPFDLDRDGDGYACE